MTIRWNFFEKMSIYWTSIVTYIGLWLSNYYHLAYIIFSMT